jgi:hypothetical protein
VRYNLSEVRKTVIGVAGLAVTVLATALTLGPDLIPNSWLPWVQIVVAVATSYGIFAVPNQPAPGHRRRRGVSEVETSTGGPYPPDVPAHRDPGP